MRLKKKCKCIKNDYREIYGARFYANNIYRYDEFKTHFIVHINEYSARYDRKPDTIDDEYGFSTSWGIYFEDYFISHDELRDEKINSILDEI